MGARKAQPGRDDEARTAGPASPGRSGRSGRSGLSTITLTGLRVRGRHGVLESERADGQDFAVDAVLWADTRPAAASDEIAMTIDYGDLASRLEQVVAGEPVALIETLAERLAAVCLDDDRVRRARVTVHKPQAPLRQDFADVSVTVTRARPRALPRRPRRAVPGAGGSGRLVVLALGSNLGDRLASLQTGLDALTAGRDLEPVAVSGVYESDPVGGPAQPDYLNAVVLARGTLPAREILSRCQAAERALGRSRAVRWGPRTFDADIIACGEVVAERELTVPHPRAHERAFVLAPWLEIDPAASIPGRGPVGALLAAAMAGSAAPAIRRRPDLRLELPWAPGWPVPRRAEVRP